jgi:hypothetical protein
MKLVLVFPPKIMLYSTVYKLELFEFYIVGCHAGEDVVSEKAKKAVCLLIASCWTC